MSGTKLEEGSNVVTDDSASEDEFAASFAKQRGNMAASTTAAISEPESEEPKPSADAQAPVENAPEGDATEGESEEPEWKREMRKLREESAARERSLADRLFGKFGEVQKQITAMQSRSPNFKFTAEHFKKIGENFDPELAEALAEGLNNGVPVAETIEREGSNVKPEEIETAISGLLDKAVPTIEERVAERLARKDFEKRHADFEEYTKPGGSKNDVFARWLQTKTPEQAHAIRNSKSYADALSNMDEFKQWEASQGKPSPKNTAPDKNARRLAANITPTGGKPPASKSQPSEEDDFNAGFKSVRGSRL